MFTYLLTEDAELRLLETRHAQALFDLVDRNRAHLREWLPWLDANRTADDSRNFIKDTLQQFADNEGFQAGIWYQGQLAGVVGYHKIDWFNRQVEIGFGRMPPLANDVYATASSIGVNSADPSAIDRFGSSGLVMPNCLRYFTRYFTPTLLATFTVTTLRDWTNAVCKVVGP